MRYKITLEYDGTGLYGWQAQTKGSTVQALVETAVSHLTGEATSVYGAGRTDAGVHALGQVAHFDCPKCYADRVVMNALNFYLKHTAVTVVAAQAVAGNFHARFSALNKTYRYRLLTRAAPSSLRRNYTWHQQVNLDFASVAAGCQLLLGYHDFSAFRNSSCQGKSPFRTIDQLTCTGEGDELHFTVTARSFLHNQVRIIVGTLVALGSGKLALANISLALQSGQRSLLGATAPPQGLYLVAVTYPSQLEVAADERSALLAAESAPRA